MKHLKWFVPLAVVILMLLIALPAAADDPFGGPPSKTSGNGTTTWAAIYVGGTYDNKRGMDDGFYHDPSTGCFPGGGQVVGGAVPMTYAPEPQAGNMGVTAIPAFPASPAKVGNGQIPQAGIATQLNQPGYPDASPPYIVGTANQNGQEFRVGGTVATPCVAGLDSLTGVVDSVEYDRYVTNWSAAVTIPGGFASRWFKFDTVKSRDVEVYVDDVPKWGAAYRYFDNQGCFFSGNGDCDKSDNLQRIGIDTSEIGKWEFTVQDRYDWAVGDKQNGHNGINVRVYTPDAIRQPDFFWPTPNNALLTTRAGAKDRVADTQGVYGGYNRGFCSGLCGTWANAGTLGSYVYMDDGDKFKAGDGNTHLLANKWHWDGWVYMRAFNYMIWDQAIRVGTRFTPRAGYDFPCDNCPYPFNATEIH